MKRACLIAALVKKINGVRFTDEERVSVAFLLAFLSMNVDRIMSTSSIAVMSRLRLGWYTSAKCSDVR